jgi:hypothetical protein
VLGNVRCNVTCVLQVDFDIGDGSSVVGPDFTDSASWSKMLNKSAAFQLPAAFTPTVTARRIAVRTNRGGHRYINTSSNAAAAVSAHEKDMFLVMAKPVMQALMTLWDITNDDDILYRYDSQHDFLLYG